MAKEVTLEVQIDEKGQIHVEPKGTQGAECLNLMAFLDKVKGLTVVETTPNDDMKEKKVQQVGKQRLG
jgi:putative aminopeptidase FrvX